MQRLAEALSAQKCNVVEKWHTEDSNAEKERLKVQGKKWKDCVVELKGKFWKGKNTVTSLDVKLWDAIKWLDFLAYKTDILLVNFSSLNAGNKRLAILSLS